MAGQHPLEVRIEVQILSLQLLRGRVMITQGAHNPWYLGLNPSRAIEVKNEI
jgi:hypothetical protein